MSTRPGTTSRYCAKCAKAIAAATTNVLAGWWQDLPVKEADYWHSARPLAGGQAGRDHSYFSIVVVDLAASMPYVSVQRTNLYNRAAEQPGMHQIDFESEDFNQKFSVTAPARSSPSN